MWRRTTEDKKHKKIIERGQGDSWRPQCLEAFMDALCSTREKKDLMMMMMITMMNCGVTVSRIQRITANIRIAVLNCDW